MSTTVKFVYVKWSGGSVPFTKRGRYGVVQGSIEKLFVVSSSLFRQLPIVCGGTIAPTAPLVLGCSSVWVLKYILSIACGVIKLVVPLVFI